MTGTNSYRRVPVGQTSHQAVTIGIETAADGRTRAAVWWEAKGDVDADEVEYYYDINEAFRAAAAARELHGFDEVVVALANPDLWRAEWGNLLEGLPNEDASCPESVVQLHTIIENERDDRARRFQNRICWR